MGGVKRPERIFFAEDIFSDIFSDSEKLTILIAGFLLFFSTWYVMREEV